jgi:hypothetical protein
MKSVFAVECGERHSTTRGGGQLPSVEEPNMKTIAFFLATLVPAIASAQGKPTTGYAPVNGLKMYYEVHGSGDPVVLLHGAFMTISSETERLSGNDPPS